MSKNSLSSSKKIRDNYWWKDTNVLKFLKYRTLGHSINCSIIYYVMFSLQNSNKNLPTSRKPNYVVLRKLVGYYQKVYVISELVVIDATDVSLLWQKESAILILRSSTDKYLQLYAPGKQLHNPITQVSLWLNNKTFTCFVNTTVAGLDVFLLYKYSLLPFNFYYISLYSIHRSMLATGKAYRDLIFDLDYIKGNK